MRPGQSSTWPLNKGAEIMVSTVVPSDHLNDNKVKVSFHKENGNVLMGSARLYLTSVAISLQADTRRDGKVNMKNTNKSSWTWGPYGHGAILLVNCDKDQPDSKDMDNEDEGIFTCKDLEDMSILILKTQGPKAFFKTHGVLLHVSPPDSEKLGVFHQTETNSGSKYRHVLGREKLFYHVEYNGELEHVFYVEGLTFPDADFSGLLSISATLLEVSEESFPETPVFTEEIVFRVAPWIMTPNTLSPQEVYVCSLPFNQTFLEQVSDLVQGANCKLRICPPEDSRSDQWIQDEMEFGYTESPKKCFPVVFDSPRNRGLKDFPFKKILGPDFGYVTREPKNSLEVSSQDAFGNLEVSPPVTVRGKVYPLGRILIGNITLTNTSRRMSKVVRDFLYAQQVQPPVELYVDWLLVGHVDEFMTFVPADSLKGFRLLLASPSACYRLFREKQQQGHGDAVMFQGLKAPQRTIDNILSDEKMRVECHYVQSCINWNRNILKKELGLTEQDIIDIPVLFSLELKKARAFFPNMVNMLVLGSHLGIPKPFGPIIDGKCCLEEEVQSLLEPLGLHCTFIDDYLSYHQYDGNVHCGTNVLRHAFSFKWWNMDVPALSRTDILSAL
ncbi:protein-arginine deiminase type-3-like isoform X2 [Lissotriton helveticus]